MNKSNNNVKIELLVNCLNTIEKQSTRNISFGYYIKTINKLCEVAKEEIKLIK